MTSNTQTSNIMASVDKAFDLYMVEVASQLDLSDEVISTMKRLWQPRREELAESCAKKKTKRKRSSSGKKRAKSAYMFFCAEMRETLKSEQPDLKGRDVMTELGKRWKEAKQGDTSKWDELAKQDKERVKAEETKAETDSEETKAETDSEETKAETDSEEESSPKKKKSSSPKKKSSSPKKRVYPYNFWAKLHRGEIGSSTGLKGKELTKALRETWKELSKEEKAEWKESAIKAAED